MKLLLRWLINALALVLCANIVAGFQVDGFYAALIAALVLGLLNALVRPVLILLTLPVTLITIGLFTFVINAALVWLMTTMVKGISVDGFLSALMVAIILWAVGTVTSWLLTEAKE